MIFQAHRGVSTENPENTMPAFLAAVRQGYKIIELDVSITKDQKFVLLHDALINRTARYKNGDEIPSPIKISDITYEESKAYDFGIWFSKKFKDTPLTLLEDVLKFAKEKDIKIKIDNKYEKFDSEQKKSFFEILKPYVTVACLTCSEVDSIKEAYHVFPNMHFHYDGVVTQEILNELSSILSKEQLTIWLSFKDNALASQIKQQANLGLWILSTPEQLHIAEQCDADIIETNGQLKPVLNKGLIADMHTHSENSHDSVCKISDMQKAEYENKTNIFAVTDHFDTASYTRYDIFSPIKNSWAESKKLNSSQIGSTALSGVEISESFWHPEIYSKLSDMMDCDVIIGSVHLVKYKNLTSAYSGIDFSRLYKNTITEYLDAYFDDMLKMIEYMDFDILAHLTCPLRYISGKYKIKIDLSHYSKKIERILELIIKKGISLEVNTSAFDTLDDFMPSVEILKKYYDMGGYLLTLGSDAHISQNASIHFNEAILALKDIGFKNIFYYKQRELYQITI